MATQATVIYNRRSGIYNRRSGIYNRRSGIYNRRSGESRNPEGSVSRLALFREDFLDSGFRRNDG